MKPVIYLVLAWLIASPKLFSQPISLMERIRQDSTLEFFMTVDWKDLIKTKNQKAYHRAKVIFVKAPEDSIQLTAQVKTRGQIRLEICQYPPLKLKFKKSHLARYELSGLNEIDIVYPCRQGDLYEQLVLKEYLAYKIWALVSPYGFKTQLVRFHYINEEGLEEREPSIGMLVENTEETADRLSGRRIETPIISTKAVEPEAALKMALFQFMIGNTDWNIQNRHNLDFLALPGHSLLITLPYDFDYSELVNAPYAVPHESIKSSLINTRYYQGDCCPAEMIEAELKVFLAQKENILSMPLVIPGLNEKSAQQVRQYLNQFFEIIEHPQKLKHQILKHCDMWPVEN